MNTLRTESYRRHVGDERAQRELGTGTKVQIFKCEMRHFKAILFDDSSGREENREGKRRRKREIKAEGEGEKGEVEHERTIWGYFSGSLTLISRSLRLRY